MNCQGLIAPIVLHLVDFVTLGHIARLLSILVEMGGWQRHVSRWHHFLDHVYLFGETSLIYCLDELHGALGAHMVFENLAKHLWLLLPVMSSALIISGHVPKSDQTRCHVVFDFALHELNPVARVVMNLDLPQVVRIVKPLDGAICNDQGLGHLEIEGDGHSVGVVGLIVSEESWVLFAKVAVRVSCLYHGWVLLLIGLCLNVGQVEVLVFIVLNFVTFLAPHVVHEELHLCLEHYLLGLGFVWLLAAPYG